MPMVCPQCRNAFEERVECPTCGVRLSYQAQRLSASLAAPGPEESWQQTPWARIFVGVLLAQGLYYALWHLILSAQSALGGFTTLPTLVVQQALQILSVLIGGAIAGAGQPRGATYGAVVGIWNGVLLLVYLLLFQARLGQPLTLVALYVMPVLHTTFGALGGALGS